MRIIAKLLACLFLLTTIILHSETISHEILRSFFPVSFYDSMNAWGRFSKNYIQNNIGIERAAELYEKFVVKDLAYSQEPRIPKIIHQIWLGSPFPEKFKAYQQSWIDMNPGWQYMLWTEKEIEEFGLINKDRYDAAPNKGMKSDIARLEILDIYGGVYVDTDFECLKSFNVLHHCFDFYVGCNDDVKLALFNGLIGSCPKHPILRRCIDALHNTHLVYNYATILNLTGPYFFTQQFLNSLNDPVGRCVVLPVSYFYPYSNYCLDAHNHQRAIKEKCVKQESFAIHWFACSWQH